MLSPKRGFFNGWLIGEIMFTGIISCLGKFKKDKESIYTFSAPKTFCESLKKGTSIAINGVCLTVTSKSHAESFSVEIMPETSKRTMFSKLKNDDLVNLELPVTVNTLLSGHIVQGHVDGVGTIREIKKVGNSKIFKIEFIEFPKKLGKYVVEKGSITVNGISLTVIEVGKDYFTVGIIPYTWKHTMLHKARIGNLVNIEVDILAKYLEKILAPQGIAWKNYEKH